LSARQQAVELDAILAERFTTIAPALMRREGIDMWLLISRENNEDSVLMTMLPSDWFKARRRTMLVLFDRGIDADGVDLGVETLAVARYNVGEVFQSAWDPEQQPDQWQRLVELIVERQPQRIGVNQSLGFAAADGLIASEKEALLAYLPAAYQQRVVSAEKLAVGWLETRTAAEIEHYQHAVGWAQQVITEGFSNAVVELGVTTTTDLEWWMLERIYSMNLGAWFPPTVTLQRQGEANPRLANAVIQAGDLLHVDIGVTYMRLNTDTQQHAYVLREGETAAPASLHRALAAGNQLQDVLTSEFASGRSGNDILLSALDKAKQQGLRPSIYSHPIGYHGHAVGPTIGMWDAQRAIPVTGDYPLYPNTAHSIELNNTFFSDDWGQDVVIMLEESSWFDGQQVHYLHGRQQQFHFIRE
jgi:Xaa-Pro aminopeptidase